MFWFIPIILGGLGGVALASIAIVISEWLTSDKVHDTVKTETLEMPDAFKYKIKDAKERKVHIGIYGKNSEELMNIEIESEKGISEDICVDKWEYI